MKKYTKLILILFILGIYSCAQDSTDQQHDSSYTYSTELESEPLEEESETNSQKNGRENQHADVKPSRSPRFIQRKLIKEGNISFETNSPKKTKALIHKVTNDLKGYLARDNENSDEYEIRHDITVRIPSKNFDQLLINISESVEEIDDQHITVKDVTEEYVDVAARIRAKKNVESRYLELLNKAHTIPDILKVEHELARLREEIEAKEGRLRFLKDQSSWSTLHITFYQKLEPEEKEFEFISKAGNGFSNGFTGLLWLLLGLINIWPILLLVALVVFTVIKITKRSLKKN